MHQPNKKIPEIDINVKFSDMKLPVALFVFNLFIMQAAYHLILFLAENNLNPILSSINITLMPTQGLRLFAGDMWVITVILMIASFFIAKLRKVKKLPLALLAVYPALIILISMARDASTLIATVVIIVIYIVVTKVNATREEAQELQKRAKLQTTY